MPISMPVEYIQNESGMTVTVTEVTEGMSLIGPDYFDLGELKAGDYIVDFPDGSVWTIGHVQLQSEFRKKD